MIARRTAPLVAIALLSLLVLPGRAPRAEEPAIEADAKAAAAFYEAFNYISAAPIYERLSAARPETALYAERAAMCLMVQAQTMAPGPGREPVFQRAKSHAERARALGDKGSTMDLLFEQIEKGVPTGEIGDGDPRMADAERAFAAGDDETALRLYLAIAESNPASYEARLYAGDAYFKRKDLQRAGDWYAKAIAVDPDRETAYRYWGDVLARDGQRAAALGHLIDAVIASPYERRTWAALDQWAHSFGATLRAPQVPAPRGAMKAKDDGGVELSIDPTKLKDASVGAAWIGYGMVGVEFHKTKFHEAYPDEPVYRHSLAEEALALKMAAMIAGDGVGRSADFGDLGRLVADDMLEPYVLLNAADQGISKDYAAYRAGHREQLHRYIEKYIVHAGTAATH